LTREAWKKRVEIGGAASLWKKTTPMSEREGISVKKKKNIPLKRKRKGYACEGAPRWDGIIRARDDGRDHFIR